MIVVVSHPDDDHAQAVLAALGRLGEDAILLDLAEYPQGIQIAMHYRAGEGSRFALDLAGERHVELNECRSAWWRRPRPYVIAQEIVDPGHRTFAYTESHEAIDGLWRAVDLYWINHPTREEVASRKSFQLHVAESVGLEIPRTLITNNPSEARAFIESNRSCGTIYKAFLATERDWRETRLLRPEELALLDRVRFAPVIFQEYVPADVDLRVTVVGQDIFPAAIVSRETAYRFDWRMDMDHAHMEPCDLPPPVVSGIRRLMDRLGLVYGAIDMRRTPDGRHVFLEVNPSGQWLFIEEKTKQPISDTMARALATGGRSRTSPVFSSIGNGDAICPPAAQEVAVG